MHDEQAIEKEIQEKGLNAPRLTPEHIDSRILTEHYFTALHGRDGAIKHQEYLGTENPEAEGKDLIPLSLLTICVLVLKNGFMVTGESACPSPEIFDAAIGRKIAFVKAREKIWPLEAYVLKQRLRVGVKVGTDALGYLVPNSEEI